MRWSKLWKCIYFKTTNKNKFCPQRSKVLEAEFLSWSNCTFISMFYWSLQKLWEAYRPCLVNACLGYLRGDDVPAYYLLHFLEDRSTRCGEWNDSMYMKENKEKKNIQQRQMCFAPLPAPRWRLWWKPFFAQTVCFIQQLPPKHCVTHCSLSPRWTMTLATLLTSPRRAHFLPPWQTSGR